MATSKNSKNTSSVCMTVHYEIILMQGGIHVYWAALTYRGAQTMSLHTSSLQCYTLAFAVNGLGNCKTYYCIVISMSAHRDVVCPISIYLFHHSSPENCQGCLLCLFCTPPSCYLSSLHFCVMLTSTAFSFPSSLPLTILHLLHFPPPHNHLCLCLAHCLPFLPSNLKRHPVRSLYIPSLARTVLCIVLLLSAGRGSGRPPGYLRTQTRPQKETAPAGDIQLFE